MIHQRPEPKGHRTPAQREDDAMLLVAQITETLRVKCCIPEAQAGSMAKVVVDEMRLQNPAQRLYLPAPDRSVRDAAIRAKFNGQNAAECCREFKISRTRLYEIVGRRAPV